MILREKPLCQRTSLELPELVQYLTDILFNPPPPTPFFIPSPMQWRGQLGHPHSVSGWGTTRLCRSKFWAQGEAKFHDGPGGVQEGLPTLRVVRAEFTTAGQIDGTDVIRIRICCLVIVVLLADKISLDLGRSNRRVDSSAIPNQG